MEKPIIAEKKEEKIVVNIDGNIKDAMEVLFDDWLAQEILKLPTDLEKRFYYHLLKI